MYNTLGVLGIEFGLWTIQKIMYTTLVQEKLTLTEFFIVFCMIICMVHKPSSIPETSKVL